LDRASGSNLLPVENLIIVALFSTDKQIAHSMVNIITGRALSSEKIKEKAVLAHKSGNFKALSAMMPARPIR
jgi:hypothetical protein